MKDAVNKESKNLKLQTITVDPLLNSINEIGLLKITLEKINIHGRTTDSIFENIDKVIGIKPNFKLYMLGEINQLKELLPLKTCGNSQTKT